MARDPHSGAMSIGEVLKQARTRQGLEMRDIEDRTKIRIKYLRALEAEDWEVLPSAAYAKGFLRTYAKLLGLDADAVVDEFRRQVESRFEPEHPLRVGEPVLEARRRLPDRQPRRPGPAVLVGVGVVAAVAALAAIGLLGGDDSGDGDSDRRSEARQEARQERRAQQRRRERREQRQAAAESRTVTLRLDVESDMQVCLLAGSGEVLIANQVLSAGSEERFERERFELRFPFGYDRGQFTLFLDGQRTQLPELSGPAAFAIEPGERPRQLDTAETTCP